MPVRLIAKLKQKNDADFPLLDDIDLYGGLQVVATNAVRDAIPQSRRKQGMYVAVDDSDGFGTHALYRLVGGINNVNWEEAFFSTPTTGVSDDDAWKAPVLVATTDDLNWTTNAEIFFIGPGSITLGSLEPGAPAGLGTIDGIEPEVGNRILIKDAGSASSGADDAYNGIWRVTGGASNTSLDLVRTDDADSDFRLKGAVVLPIRGTSVGKIFIQTALPSVIDTDPVTWQEVSGGGGGGGGGLDKFDEAASYVADDVVWRPADGNIYVATQPNGPGVFTYADWKRLSDSHLPYRTEAWTGAGATPTPFDNELVAATVTESFFETGGKLRAQVQSLTPEGLISPFFNDFESQTPGADWREFSYTIPAVDSIPGMALSGTSFVSGANSLEMSPSGNESPMIYAYYPSPITAGEADMGALCWFDLSDLIMFDLTKEYAALRVRSTSPLDPVNAISVSINRDSGGTNLLWEVRDSTGIIDSGTTAINTIGGFVAQNLGADFIAIRLSVTDGTSPDTNVVFEASFDGVDWGISPLSSVTSTDLNMYGVKGGADVIFYSPYQILNVDVTGGVTGTISPGDAFTTTGGPTNPHDVDSLVDSGGGVGAGVVFVSDNTPTSGPDTARSFATGDVLTETSAGLWTATVNSTTEAVLRIDNFFAATAADLWVIPGSPSYVTEEPAPFFYFHDFELDSTFAGNAVTGEFDIGPLFGGNLIEFDTANSSPNRPGSNSIRLNTDSGGGSAPAGTGIVRTDGPDSQSFSVRLEASNLTGGFGVGNAFLIQHRSDPGPSTKGWLIVFDKGASEYTVLLASDFAGLGSPLAAGSTSLASATVDDWLGWRVSSRDLDDADADGADPDFFTWGVSGGAAFTADQVVKNDSGGDNLYYQVTGTPTPGVRPTAEPAEWSASSAVPPIRINVDVDEEQTSPSSWTNVITYLDLVDRTPTTRGVSAGISTILLLPTAGPGTPVGTLLVDNYLWYGIVRESGADGTIDATAETLTSAGAAFQTNLVEAGHTLRVLAPAANAGDYAIVSVDDENTVTVADFAGGNEGPVDFEVFATDYSEAAATPSYVTGFSGNHGSYENSDIEVDLDVTKVARLTLEGTLPTIPSGATGVCFGWHNPVDEVAYCEQVTVNASDQFSTDLPLIVSVDTSTVNGLITPLSTQINDLASGPFPVGPDIHLQFDMIDAGENRLILAAYIGGYFFGQKVIDKSTLTSQVFKPYLSFFNSSGAQQNIDIDNFEVSTGNDIAGSVFQTKSILGTLNTEPFTSPDDGLPGQTLMALDGTLYRMS